MLNRELQIAARTALVTLLLTGVAYPLVTTGLALLLFPNRASGSLVADEHGRPVGSELIAQPFGRPEYLIARPSAAGEKGYDATSSGGSNLGPTSKALHDRAEKEAQRLVVENPNAEGPVPAELVSTSASGLDPQISPANASAQAVRVAKSRGISIEQVNQMVARFTEGATLGLLGEPRVNVLKLNLALDQEFTRK